MDNIKLYEVKRTEVKHNISFIKKTGQYFHIAYHYDNDGNHVDIYNNLNQGMFCIIYKGAHIDSIVSNRELQIEYPEDIDLTYVRIKDE